MHLYSTRWNCFSFGKHPPVLQFCNRSCQVLAEGRVARRVSVSHRTTKEPGGRSPPPPPWHTEILSISVLQTRYYAQKVCAGFLEILYYLEVKSTYPSQGCVFPLGKAKTEKFSHSFDLWVYRNCRTY